ncbi:LisH domain-containing protein [Entamoeba marina]
MNSNNIPHLQPHTAGKAPMFNQMQQPIYQQPPPQQQQFQQYDQQQQQNNYDGNYVAACIEQYLQFYYSYQQIVSELEKKGIQQEFTLNVLQNLIQQNPEYFKAYEVRISLNDQIDRFNRMIRRYFQPNQPQNIQQQQYQQQQQYNADMSGDYNSFISAGQTAENQMGI